MVATPPGTDLSKPYLLVGAHLDTVPQAPGAEDNASGIAVLLELARVYGPAGGTRTRLPVVLVAFGAEEPRGDGDARHHYGSRAYVAAMPRAQRTALRGMLSLDRVGVGTVVPVCTADDRGRALQDEVLAARRAAASAGAPIDPATTGRSPGRACPAYVSAALRTPSTTARATCPVWWDPTSWPARPGWSRPG